MYVACLSESEAIACIRDYKSDHAYSSEAVNAFGGTKRCLAAASRAWVRHIIAGHTLWRRSTAPVNYRSLGG
jgi:hypothetical protein